MRKGKSLTQGRRVLALALCLALLCPLLGSPGFAEEADGGLCEHHPAHTADCGFSAGSPESPCAHVHDESCYTLLCLHEGEEGHVCSEESGCLTLACTHVHDESCSYAPEVPAAPCEFNCPDCAGEETPVPTETPVPAETPGPTEDPEPTETPEPTEIPESSESPGPSEEPALPVMTLSGAELTDAESGEPLWSWVSGEEPEEALWPLQGEQLLTLRVNCPAEPESEASRQLRLSLSPLLCLTGWEEAEGLSFAHGPLDEEGAPPVSGGELLCTLEPTVSSLELKLRLTADAEAWEARNAAVEEPAEPMPEELLRAELLVNGETPEEPALLLKGFLDPGVSLTALQVLYTRDTSGKNFANLVLFAYFQDDAEGAAYFQDSANAEKIINAYDGSHGRSFKNYMETISYHKFHVLNLFPQYDESSRTIQAVQLSCTRAQADKNIDTLIIDEAIRDLSIDQDCLDLTGGDGIIDNVTVVLYSPNDTASSQASIHPHKSNYPGTQQIAGKSIGAYNILNTYRLIGSTLASEGALIAHEFLHTLGYPDLYRSYAGDTPVGNWDIMAGTSPYPQWPLAYLRAHFSNWISLETVTESKTLTMFAPGTGDGNQQAYILQSPLNENELFVVEMRRKNDGDPMKKDSLDAKLGDELTMSQGESGLIVYRVDTTVEGLSNYHGRTGVYIFRPQSGYDSDVLASHAAFLAPGRGRTSLGSDRSSATLADGALTFSDGSNSCIVIQDVRNNEDGSMSCQVQIPRKEDYDLWEDTEFQSTGSALFRSAATASYQGQQVLVLCEGTLFQAYRYTGSSWEKWGQSFTDSIMSGSSLKMTEHGGRLYLGFLGSDGSIRLRSTDAEGQTWSGPVSYDSGFNGIELLSQGSDLYAVYDKGNNEAGLLRLNGGSLELVGSYYSGRAGQPHIAAVGDALYVAVRKSDNGVVIYCREGGGFRQVTGVQITANDYGIVNLNGKLTAVTTDSNTVTVYTYDGSQWTKGQDRSINCADPKLTVVQGQLYLLTSPSTGVGNTYVYQYDASSDSWIQEGGIVDAASQQITLTADGDYLYISYVLNGDSHVVGVKRKAVANTLLSIQIQRRPSRTSYVRGEEPSIDGLVVTAQYVRGADVTLAPGQYSVSGYDSSTVGNREATVSFGGKSASFPFQITEPAVAGLAQPGLGAVTDTGRGLRFSWSAVSGAAKYRVFVRFGSESWRPLSVTGALSLTWTPDRGAGTYAFTVQALSADEKTASPYHPSGLSIAYEPLKLTLTPPSGYGDGHIFIDGREYTAKKSGGSYSITLPDAKGKTAVMYKYSGTVPVGMAVWRLSYQGTKVTSTELTGLRDLISYHGFSIRIQAPAGIRFKSGISEATRARLLGGGVDGCRLLEYGTLFMTQQNRKTLPFVKGGEKVGGGRAYWSEKGKVTDLVYERVSGRLRFTSVLINLAPDMYSVALAFRGYAILDQGGEQLIIYGPPVSRSVADVAQQVMNAREFPPGSAGYSFVQNILNSVKSR